MNQYPVSLLSWSETRIYQDSLYREYPAGGSCTLKLPESDISYTEWPIASRSDLSIAGNEALSAEVLRRKKRKVSNTWSGVSWSKQVRLPLHSIHLDQCRVVAVPIHHRLSCRQSVVCRHLQSARSRWRAKLNDRTRPMSVSRIKRECKRRTKCALRSHDRDCRGHDTSLSQRWYYAVR